LDLTCGTAHALLPLIHERQGRPGRHRGSPRLDRRGCGQPRSHSEAGRYLHYPPRWPGLWGGRTVLPRPYRCDRGHGTFTVIRMS